MLTTSSALERALLFAVIVVLLWVAANFAMGFAESLQHVLLKGLPQ